MTVGKVDLSSSLIPIDVQKGFKGGHDLSGKPMKVSNEVKRIATIVGKYKKLFLYTLERGEEYEGYTYNDPFKSYTVVIAPIGAKTMTSVYQRADEGANNSAGVSVGGAAPGTSVGIHAGFNGCSAEHAADDIRTRTNSTALQILIQGGHDAFLCCRPASELTLSIVVKPSPPAAQSTEEDSSRRDRSISAPTNLVRFASHSLDTSALSDFVGPLHAPQRDSRLARQQVSRSRRESGRSTASDRNAQAMSKFVKRLRTENKRRDRLRASTEYLYSTRLDPRNTEGRVGRIECIERVYRETRRR